MTKSTLFKLGFALWLVFVATFTAMFLPPAVQADCSDGSANFYHRQYYSCWYDSDDCGGDVCEYDYCEDDTCTGWIEFCSGSCASTNGCWGSECVG